MEEKQGFVFLPSYYEAIRELPPEERLEVYDALCQYALDGVWPEELGTVPRIILRLIRPTLDQGQRKYRASVENGKKGGNPNFKRGCPNPYYPKDNPKDNPGDNQDKDREKDMDKETDTDQEREKETETESASAAAGEPKTGGAGKYANVFLSSEEWERLKKNFPLSWQWHIDRLSELIFAGRKLPRPNHWEAIRDLAEADMLQGKIHWGGLPQRG